MDVSRIARGEIYGAVASAVLVASLLFLDWFSLSAVDSREEQNIGWLCGTGDFDCTGFESFPILRWLLIAAATAPLILAWIMARQHKLSWAPGELTMVVGFTAFVLLLYNGFIDKPGVGVESIGVSLQLGYWVAVIAAAGISLSGIARTVESQKGAARKAPGTV